MKRVTRSRAVVGVLLAAFLPPQEARALAWFVVAENPSLFEECHRCDSYLLPISDPADIAHAREIIARGGAPPDVIVAAEIAAGSDGINRDVLADGEPPWSWHVTRFLDFIGGGTIPQTEGWPGAVEIDVAGWIADHPFGENGAPTVAFANYTVVAELPEPGALGAAVACLTLLLAGSWRSRGPGR